MNCEIFGQSTFLHQSLLFKLYSRMYQNQGDKLPKDIHPIDALKSYGDLNQIKFVQKHEPEKPNNKTNLVQIDSSTKFLAFDVQFLHSQGLRSELVEISACDVQNPDLKFHVSCYAFDEPALKVDPEFQSIQDGLKSFVNWIQNWKCVLIQLNPHKRAWPGFINHLCFYDFLPCISTNLIGIVDLKNILPNEYSKLDSLDKLHKILFKETIELYKSKEVLNSICQIVDRFNIEDLKKHVQDTRSTLLEIRNKLNKSLGDDISCGNYYPKGHIANFRIDHNYFNDLLK